MKQIELTTDRIKTAALLVLVFAVAIFLAAYAWAERWRYHPKGELRTNRYTGATQKLDHYYGWVSPAAALKLENIRALEARRDAAQQNVERLRRDVQGLTDVLAGKAPLVTSGYHPDLTPPGAGPDYIFSREYLVKVLRKLKTELASSTDDVETLSEDLRKAWANLSDS